MDTHPAPPGPRGGAAPALAAAVLLAAGLVLSACAADPAARAAPALRVVPAVTMAPQPLPPPPAPRLAAPVAEGTVTHLPGPFDHRVALTGTRLDDGTLDASLRVAGLVVLEAVAHFYDADGALLGTTRRTHAPGRAGGPGEAVALELAAAPAYRARVASAALQVPVLVGG